MHNALREFKANIFQGLSHPTRIAIVEVLRDGELAVGTIIERLGIEPANASQHFGVLKSKYVLSSRREGNQVFYSVRDPLLIDVLDIMRTYFQAHVDEAMAHLIEARAATQATYDMDRHLARWRAVLRSPSLYYGH